MAVIVTVHGTSAGAPEDEGPKWWQRGSDFQNRLASWLDLEGANARVEPFHWGEGPNSELARRKAGQQLLAKLRQYERQGTDYYLIGHSHGGSVIYHALLEASGRKIDLPHLKQWITIGTPFIWMQRNRLFVQRLGHMGKIAYTMMIASIAGLVIGGPTLYLYGKELHKAFATSMDLPGAAETRETLEAAERSGMLDAQMVWQLLAIPLTALLLFVWLRWRQGGLKRRYADATRRFFDRAFTHRWHSLRSKEDEAINALRAAKPLKVSLFQRNILTEPVKNAVVYAFILFYAFTLLWQTYMFFRHGFSAEYFKQVWSSNPLNLVPIYNVPDFSQMTPNPIDFSKALALTTTDPLIAVGVVAGVLLALPFALFIMGGMLWLLFTLLHFFGYALGIPAAWFLNTLTSSRLRDNAYGNDTIGEHVVDVMPMPEQCNRDCGLVPPDVEAALREHAEKHATLALARARTVLGMKTELQGQDDLAQALGDQLTGGELVHTAYFDVEPFAKLVAACLHQGGCARFSSQFEGSEDYHALLACLEETQKA